MKKILAGTVTLVGIGLCMIMGSNEPKARAASASECERYANEAVHANEQNQQLGCGFAGPEWQSNYANHYGWCLNIRDPASLANETNKRNAALAICPRCVSYAKESVTQNEQNLSLHCGYTGPAWQSNYGNHFGWCMVNSTDSAESERAKRIEALSFCNTHPATL